jgi:hypothetical protein
VFQQLTEPLIIYFNDSSLRKVCSSPIKRQNIRKKLRSPQMEIRKESSTMVVAATLAMEKNIIMDPQKVM